ncbi:MAG: hypothetical protein IKO62_04920 [Bacteroidales bacterium]|nr:hypothetical protein [Bacteroidales bacterium]
MDKILEKNPQIKLRAMQFIKNQNISKSDFCAKTGISYSNVKGNAQKSELGGEQISKILEIYPELSADWLVTGRGPMLRNNIVQSIEGDHNIQTAGNGNITVSHRELEDKISFLEDNVLFLTEQLKEKDNQINTLLSIIQKQ